MNPQKFNQLCEAAELILTAVKGPDWKHSPSLSETPKRVARFINFMTEGEDCTNAQIAEMFCKTFSISNNAMVVEKGIPIFSTCEHHLALMYDMNVSIGYIPNGKVIGLSKLARIAKMCAHRLQLQERIGQDIYEVLHQILDTEDIIVVIEGKHGCMTARGVEAREATTKTAYIMGKFADNATLRSEFYSLI